MPIATHMEPIQRNRRETTLDSKESQVKRIQNVPFFFKRKRNCDNVMVMQVGDSKPQHARRIFKEGTACMHSARAPTSSLGFKRTNNG